MGTQKKPARNPTGPRQEPNRNLPGTSPEPARNLPRTFLETRQKSARNLPLQVSGKKSKVNSIVILNITSADIKTKSADVMLKMTTMLKEMMIV